MNDHETRIEALEKWQEQTNQSISGMQELLNTTDMITSVTDVMEGGKTVGYTIHFSHSDPITIYNGTDGQTPQIGLTQATDGNWYWTLNGETLTDDEGQPIRANGSLPQISLGNSISGTIKPDGETRDPDAWYLSVDDGKTWYRVSGSDGDTWFADAPKKEGNYYLFTLADQNRTTFRVAAYQPIRILTEEEENEDDSNFDNATVLLSGETSFYLHMDDDIDYKAIVAQISSVDVVLTRAGVSDWTVKGRKEGTDIILTVTPGAQPYALLDVSLLCTDGSKLTASRLLGLCYSLDKSSNTATVYTAGGLRAVADLVNSGQFDLNITLAYDIDLSGEDWTPICPDDNTSYTGTFDGGGKTITGLKVTDDSKYAGLIGYLGGTVQNVTLEDVNITNNAIDGYAGSVVGYNAGGTVTNCHSTGTVMGPYSSGVVGYNDGGTIIDCDQHGQRHGCVSRRRGAI